MKNSILLHNFVCYEADKPQSDLSIIIEDGRIKTIDKTDVLLKTFDGEKVDLKGNYLAPGFVDLQINGGEELYFTQDLTVEAFGIMCRDHMKKGTTSMLPTVITCSFEKMVKAIEVTKEAMKNKEWGILGLHLEGPYLNVEKRGAHNTKYIRKPSDEEIDELIRIGKGVIRKMTIAPEFFSDEMIKKIKNAGIVLSAGHTMIGSEDAKRSFDAGVSCITHIYNAMLPIQGREAGLIGATILSNSVRAGIIVDGYHCSYDSFRLLYKAIGKRLFLISDATFIGNKDLVMDGVRFIYENKSYRTEQGNLAGSNITMHDAVVNCVEKAEVPLHEAFRMAAETPLDVIGDKEHGLLKEGYVADFVVLDKDNLSLSAVIKCGELVK